MSKLQQIASNTSNTGTGTSSTLPGSTTAVNEAQLIKAKIMAVVSSLETQDQERKAQKEILEQLEVDHGISKTVARKVAKLLHKQNKQDVDEENAAVDSLHSRLFKQ